MASARLVCLAWVSRRAALVMVACCVSSTWGRCVEPEQSVLEEGPIDLHPPLPFSCPGSPVLPAVLPTIVQLPISSRAFAVFLLFVYCHSVWLDRCVFECGSNAALACARVACSKPRSFHQFP